ncbi:hypothetical protein PP629_gp27 [Streptomyces phage Dubu]|uniref:Uncharacterized protein n=1 Tax=Streptomyces phage Dubu TaxID=2591226 RepID=A0A514DEU7_9CAUD|nr:hypothetical protein PP629_gp27 [Streptomyces phage Dubu]QDH92132.1 hypothetical protein SEA_DUBU_27 [Streptomyces phage Dubu]
MAKLDASPPYDWRTALANAQDDTVRSGLWNFPPEARKAVLHERRRRFGIEEERIDPATLTEEEDA